MRSIKLSIARIAAAVVLSAVAATMAVPTASAAGFRGTPVKAPAVTQCAAPVGTPGSIPAVQFTKRSWPLTGGLHMNTSGSFDRNTGTAYASVHLYNSYWGMGYTGSTMLVLRDNCGGVIGVTTPSQWGVEAKSWFWNTNERHVSYSASVHPAIANRVASVEVLHNRETGGESKKQYANIRTAACIAIQVHIPIFVKCPLPIVR